MTLLFQYSADGERRVGVVDPDGSARAVTGFATTLALAHHAIRTGTRLAEAAARGAGDPVDIQMLIGSGSLLPPVDHPEPSRCWLTGTGLTHLGSAEGRDKMHKAAGTSDDTDSMRMFRLGLEGGKPAPGAVGAQPEWFYKGNGAALVAPEAPLAMPDFALDGGEEPEIAGIYLIDDEGQPRRLGFALANEFSDHVTERGNYLWLAHSKLRPASIGPMLLAGDLPDTVQGVSRICRGDDIVWQKPFQSGEANMSHSIANLEHHHFKYPLFRRPGDLHIHFFGTATLSFSDGFTTEPGDRFEIEASAFGPALRNTLTRGQMTAAKVVPL